MVVLGAAPMRPSDNDHWGGTASIRDPGRQGGMNVDFSGVWF